MSTHPLNAINAHVGRKVAQARKRNGWTQQELAARVSPGFGRTIDATTITRLERGVRPVPVHELVSLAQLLGVDLFELLPDPDPVTVARTRVEDARARAEVAGRDLADAEAALALAEQQPVVTDEGLVFREWAPGADRTGPPNRTEAEAAAVFAAKLDAAATDVAAADSVPADSPAPTRTTKRGSHGKR